MTNTMKFYTPNWDLIVSYSLNADINVDGVCFDGQYFWTLEGASGTNVLQYQMTASGPLATGFSFNAGALLPTIFVRNTAICTDGSNLYVGYEYASGGTQKKAIAAFDKKGNLLKTLGGSVQVSLGTSGYNDITFNGKLILSVDAQDTFNAFTYFDPGADGAFAAIYVADRLFAGIAFNGKDYYGVQSSLSGQGKTINTEGVVQHNGANTVASPKGLDFGTQEGVPKMMDYMGGRYTGNWIVLVHQ